MAKKKQKKERVAEEVVENGTPEEEVSEVNGEIDEESEVHKLRDQVEKLTIQLKQDSGSDVELLKTRLKEVEAERDQSKESYDALLSKLLGMKSVFTKMKEAQGELDECRAELEETKEEVESLKKEREATSEKHEAEVAKLQATVSQLTSQLGDLNAECDRLSLQLSELRREYSTKDNTMLDEKYALENENHRLTKKVNEVRSQLNELAVVKDELTMENKDLLRVVEELKEKINQKNAELETEVAAKKEVQGQLEALQLLQQEQTQRHALQVGEFRNKVELLEGTIELQKQELAAKDTTIADLQEASSKIKDLETDVNNKQLLIGKLRHEAIILNEHLTKSLTMLKQQLGSTNNTIDKELISNVIVSFLQFPRGDTKKFEALQLISALLEWDDARKIQAGLSHNQLRSQRDDDGKPVRQSFVSLWTDFLEKESTK